MYCGCAMLVCRHCCCDHLWIKQAAGFERLLIFFTRRRKYLCQRCGKVFRAPDRRRSNRDVDEFVTDRTRATWRIAGQVEPDFVNDAVSRRITLVGPAPPECE